MTMRLDLRKSLDYPGRPDRPSMNPTPFGCEWCGRWFQFARQLVEHVCAERSSDG